MKVLYIEDDQEDFEIVQDLLQSNSEFIKIEQIVRTSNLKSGLEKLSKQQYDLCLLDLNLRDYYGLETLEKVIHKVDNTPVIVLSGINSELLGLTAISMGAADYISKWEMTEFNLKRIVKFAIEGSQKNSKVC